MIEMIDSRLFYLSYGLIWLIVIALYVAVFMLYRFLGTVDWQGGEGPPINENPDPVPLTGINGEEQILGDSSVFPQLVFFASTQCGACAHVLPHLKTLAEGYKAKVRTSAVYTGGASALLEKLRSELGDTIILLEDTESRSFKAWRIKSTPFAVALDGQGRVRKVGRAGTLRSLTTLFTHASKL